MKKVSLMTFIGMTCALVGSIRPVPSVAAAGWTMIFYLLVATVLFALPIILIAAEFVGMYQDDDGGMEHWVSNSLGKKWGFTVSWLLWVQMFPGMVLIASSIPPLIGIIIGNKALGLSNTFTFISIVTVYWLITLLNLKFDMVKICGKIGIWFGLYIPLTMMTVMGIMTLVKVGVMPTGYLGGFNPGELIPDSETRNTLQYLTPIIFIFVGQEMAAVYVKRLNNPAKTYLKGALVALLFVFLINIVNGALIANVVHAGKIQLDNTAQCIEIYAKILGLPLYLSNVFSGFVFIGILVQISAWATGPAKTIVSSARKGLYPPKLRFWKVNKLDVSENVMFIQAIVISAFAVLFLIIPDINQVILVLSNAAVLQYSVAYVIMGYSIIKMRKDQPNLERKFKVGSDTTLKLVVGMLMLSILISTVFTLVTSSVLNGVFVVIITVAMVVLPIFIETKRDPKWETEVEELLDKAK